MKKSDRTSRKGATDFLEKDPNPIMGIQLDGTVVYCNPAGAKVLAYWRDKYQSIPENILLTASHSRLSNNVLQEETYIKNRTFLFSMVWIDALKQINMYGADITEKQKTKQSLLNLVHYDSLTRIANRQYFEKQLKLLLHESELKSNAVFLIDLDNFKIINDTLGHAMGDKILQAATKRMLNCLRKGDLIARLGGDEFVILLQDITSDNACIVADNINQALSKPFQYSGYTMEISCSIGIAMTPFAGKKCMDLLKHADIAMYQAKKLGKNQYFTFSDTSYQTQYQRNLTIKKDLKFANIRNQFYLEYQPQIDIHTGIVFGYEALIRWEHPELGLVSPNEFIPQAEQSGLIHTIGQWIIEQAIHDYKTTLSIDNKMLLSINISLPQLTDVHFTKSLMEQLNMSHLLHDKIILDLSEHILTTHFVELPKCLNNLHQQGIKLSLDNFGSPQIPFPSLLNMPLNYLKFDSVLIKDIEKKKKQKILLKGLLELANKLDMFVIQKGVETEKQHVLLKKMGCTYGQGNYYCKPLKIHELIAYLEKNPGNPT